MELMGAASPFPLNHLIECVENDLPSPASIEAARAAFRIAMAAYEAAREGRTVRLNEGK
jgi:predicted dehydrogenase